MSPEDRLAPKLEAVRAYLRGEFPRDEVPAEQPCDLAAGRALSWRFQVARGGKVIHEARIKDVFLQDRETPAAIANDLKWWGLAAKMRAAGAETVWVDTQGIS